VLTLLVLLAGLGERQAGDRARDPGAWTTTVLGTGLGAMLVAAASTCDLAVAAASSSLRWAATRWRRGAPAARGTATAAPPRPA
jgi:hypothetical protein